MTLFMTSHLSTWKTDVDTENSYYIYIADKQSADRCKISDNENVLKTSLVQKPQFSYTAKSRLKKIGLQI